MAEIESLKARVQNRNPVRCGLCGELTTNFHNHECDHCSELLEALGFCGCGNPEDAVVFFFDLLDSYANQASWEEKEKLVLNNPVGATNVCMYLADKLGLTEHGGSIYGAWLTPAGEKVHEYLKKVKAYQESQNAS